MDQITFLHIIDAFLVLSEWTRQWTVSTMLSGLGSRSTSHTSPAIIPALAARSGYPLWSPSV